MLTRRLRGDGKNYEMSNELDVFTFDALDWW